MLTPITLQSVKYIAAPELYILYFDHVLSAPEFDLFQRGDRVQFDGVVNGKGHPVDVCERTSETMVTVGAHRDSVGRCEGLSTRCQMVTVGAHRDSVGRCEGLSTRCQMITGGAHRDSVGRCEGLSTRCQRALASQS